MVAGSIVFSMLALASTGFEEIEVRRREPIGLMIHTPSQEVGPVPTSYILGVVSAELGLRTNYLPREIPADSWASCGGSLPCIFSNAALFEPGMRHVIWVSSLTTANTARVLLEFIDVPAAIRAAKTTTVADLASYVAQTSVRHQTDRLTLRAAEELGPVVQRFVLGIKPFAERDGQWERSGTILLEVDPPPAQLSIDELRFEAVIHEPSARLLAVPLGRSQLKLTWEGADPVVRNVEVSDGAEASVKIWREQANGPDSTVRTAGVWTGLGTALAGGGLIIAGTVLAGRPTICLAAEGVHCSPLGRGRAPFIIGSSLAAGGVGLLAGSLWVGAGSDWPWVGIVGALVLGGVTGLSLSISL